MKTKICSKCKKRKSINEFSIGIHNQKHKLKNGYKIYTYTTIKSYCKSCACEYAKKYLKNNYKKVLDAKEKFLKNKPPDYMAKAARKSYKKNIDRCRKHAIKYHKNNREKILIQRKKYHKNNREKILIKNKENRDKLTDTYIKTQLTKRNLLKAMDIPQVLIEAKRTHLQFYRLLKEM